MNDPVIRIQLVVPTVNDAVCDKDTVFPPAVTVIDAIEMEVSIENEYT